MSNDNSKSETPIFDALTNGEGIVKRSFVEHAAKAVWAFVTAFILSAVVAIIPALISGRFPSTVEWLTALGLGLAGSLGVGGTVYGVKNK